MDVTLNISRLVRLRRSASIKVQRSSLSKEQEELLGNHFKNSKLLHDGDGQNCYE